MDDYKLYRCVITSSNKRHFIGTNVFGVKFYIKKNEASKDYKTGMDYSFYAKAEKPKGLFRRIKLTPIKYDKYINLKND